MTNGELESTEKQEIKGRILAETLSEDELTSSATTDAGEVTLGQERTTSVSSSSSDWKLFIIVVVASCAILTLATGLLLLWRSRMGGKQAYHFRPIHNTGGNTLPPKRMEELARKDEIANMEVNLLDDLGQEELDDKELNPPSYRRNLRELMTQPCTSFERQDSTN